MCLGSKDEQGNPLLSVIALHLDLDWSVLISLSLLLTAKLFLPCGVASWTKGVLLAGTAVGLFSGLSFNISLSVLGSILTPLVPSVGIQ